MIPVDQTTFGVNRPPFEPGNCLSACVASILEMPVEAVPNFIDVDDADPEAWADRLDAWLAQFGVHPEHVAIVARRGPDLGPLAPDRFYILCGTSVRGFEHAIVARGDQLAHDPHPARSGLAAAHRMIILR